MRTLVMYHVWDGGTDADPIGIIPELVWENIEPEEEEAMWTAFKAAYRVADEPKETFRTAWVVMPDGDALFDVPELGAARLVEDA